MKNILLLALAVGLVGCKYENPGYAPSAQVVLWSEAESGGQTLRTEYEWALVGGYPCVVGEERTDNGTPVYVVSDYEYDGLNPTGYLKTIYSPAGTERHKMTYDEISGVQLTSDVYLNGETEPSQWMKRTLDGAKNITSQESIDHGVRTLNTDYRYETGSNGEYTTSYKSAITTDGTTVTYDVLNRYSNNERTYILRSETRLDGKTIILEAFSYDYNGDRNGYEKWEGDDMIVSEVGNVTGGFRILRQDNFGSQSNGDTVIRSYTETAYAPGSTTVAKTTEHTAYWQTRIFSIMAE